MKYFWILLFSFLLLFSCSKKAVVVPEPEPIPQKFTIETIVVSGNGKISSSATEVLAGAGITITLQPDFGYLLPKNIIVNGNTVELVSNTTSFVVNKNIKIEINFSKSKIFSAAIQYEWRLDSTVVDGVKRVSVYPDILVFKTDGTMNIKSGATGTIFTYKWNYDDTIQTLQEGGNTWNVYFSDKRMALSKDNFSYIYHAL